jgi:hypothetical protein
MENNNTIEGPDELFDEIVKDLNRKSISEILTKDEKLFIAHMMFQNFWMALGSIISENDLEPWGKKLDEISQMRIEN